MNGDVVLTLRECRKILDDESITDAELEVLRQTFYSLAPVALQHYKNKPALDLEFEERAAILEFDGGFCRYEAESMAFDFQKIKKSELS